MTEPTETTETLVYAGQRLDAKRVLRPAYAEPDNIDGGLLVYTKPLLSNVPVGTMIERTVLDDGRFYSSGPKGPRAVGRYADVEQVGLWYAAAQADRAEKNRLTSITAVTSDVEDSMAHLGHYYQNLSPAQRSGFLAWMLSQLNVK